MEGERAPPAGPRPWWAPRQEPTAPPTLTFLQARRGLPGGHGRATGQVAGERCPMVLVSQGTLPWLAELGHDDRGPTGDGAPGAAHSARPALQALLVAGTLQSPCVRHHVKWVHRREGPARAANDGAHVVLLGARGGRARVVLERGALGTEGANSHAQPRTDAGVLPARAWPHPGQSYLGAAGRGRRLSCQSILPRQVVDRPLALGRSGRSPAHTGQASSGRQGPSTVRPRPGWEPRPTVLSQAVGAELEDEVHVCSLAQKGSCGADGEQEAKSPRSRACSVPAGWGDGVHAWSLYSAMFNHSFLRRRSVLASGRIF